MIGGLGVGLCLPAMALRLLPFTAVHGIALISCRWAARTRCDKNDLLESGVGLPRTYHVFVAFSDMRCDDVCVLRGRRNTLEAFQCYRIVFAWQAQHFVHMRFTISWWAQHFCDVVQRLF